jgi:hypothetical protein
MQETIAREVVSTIAPAVRDRELARALRMHPDNMTGLHFESDTNGGLELAAKAFEKLSGGTKFKKVQDDASTEW